MNLPRFALSAVALSALLVAAACASTEEVPTTEEPAPTEPAQGSTLPPSSTGTSSTPEAPAPKCVSKCTSDLDCQNSCPKVSNAIQCCDVTTGTCYANASATCPKEEDAGDPPPAY